MSVSLIKSDTIVGYTYAADIYCPGCVIDALPTAEGEAYDGWGLAAGVRMTTEDNLSELAYAFGIDREDEHSFDSGDFPKVILAVQVDPYAVTICGGCFVHLIED